MEPLPAVVEGDVGEGGLGTAAGGRLGVEEGGKERGGGGETSGGEGKKLFPIGVATDGVGGGGRVVACTCGSW